MTTQSPAVITKRDFVVAGVSFGISGIGGALFQRWLSRAKPSLEITSFGFDGTDQPFRIPEDLRQRTEADSWGKPFGESVTFDALRGRYRSTLNLIQRHERAIPIVAKWITDTKARTVPQTATAVTQISAGEVDRHPYMQDEIVGSSLIGNIRRLQIGDPPITDHSKTEYRLTVLDRSSRAITVQFDRKAIRFPLSEMDSEHKRRLMTLMAESFAKGIVENIIFYSQFFINAARDDLLKLKAVEESLRDVLTREARLTVRIALRNAGDKPSILRQYYAASLSAKQYSQTLLLAPVNDRIASGRTAVDPLAKLLKLELEDRSSDEDELDPEALSRVLPSVRGGELMSVTGGEVKQLTLQSLKPLGNEGAKIVALFQNDIIECEVHAFLTDGTRVSSRRVPFGKSAIEQEQQDALKRASS